MSKYSEDLTKYLKNLHLITNRVLDIGGGVQLARNRLGSLECNTYKVLDNNNEKEWHEKWNGIDFEVDIDDRLDENGCGWSDVVVQGEDEKYNMIFCLEVLEYCVHIEDILTNISYCLTDRGFLYITTCFSYPIHNPIESDTSRLTRKGFERLIRGRFEILECIPRRYSPEAFEHIQQAWRIDGLRAAKHYNGHQDIGHIWKLKKI